MLHVSHEFAGFGDYWGGNGRRWDRDAGCLFAFYGPGTTLRHCVDQWVADFFDGPDCEEIVGYTEEDVRKAILDSLTEQGLKDYESDALCAPAADLEDFDEDSESPIWVLLIEADMCPDCNQPSGEDTNDGLCAGCHKLHYGG